MKLLSIDPDVNTSGYCIFIDKAYYTSGVLQFARYNHSAKYRELLISYVIGEEDIVIIEDQYLSRGRGVGFNSLKGLIRVAGLLYYISQEFTKNVFFISPLLWMRGILSTNNVIPLRKDCKKMSKMYANKYVLEQRSNNEHICDAACMGYWYIKNRLEVKT